MNLYLVSIILLSIGLILQAWFFLAKGKYVFQKYLGIIAIIIAFLIPIIKSYQDYIIAEELAIDGTIYPENHQDTKTVTIYYGGNTFSFSRNNSLENKDFYIPMKLDESDKDFIFRISEKGFFVSTIIRSFDMEIIAEIENNEWKLNPNNYFRRNYDESSLEVIDNYGIPVLQIENFNNEKIRINGVFISSNYLRLVSKDGLTRLKFDKNMRTKSNYLSLLKNHNIEKWFIYKKNRIGQRSEYGKYLRERYNTDLELRNISFTMYSFFPFNHIFDRSLQYAKILRLMSFTYKNRQREQNYIYDNKYHSYLSTLSKKIVNSYHDTLKIPICKLRNEIIRRLPRESRSRIQFNLYEDPTNLNGINNIADDLESLYRKADYLSATNNRILNELTMLKNSLQDFLSTWEKAENQLLDYYLYSFPYNNKNFVQKSNERFRKSDSLRIEREFEYKNRFYINTIILRKELLSRMNMKMLNKKKFLKQYEYESGENPIFTKKIINELKYLEETFVQQLKLSKVTK